MFSSSTVALGMRTTRSCALVSGSSRTNEPCLALAVASLFDLDRGLKTPILQVPLKDLAVFLVSVEAKIAKSLHQWWAFLEPGGVVFNCGEFALTANQARRRLFSPRRSSR